MFTLTVMPRFGDMDVLGHINNTVLAAWFELARNPLFDMFPPVKDMTDKTFPLIMAHTDYDFISEMHFAKPVEIRSHISRIGNKSFTVHHEAWQEGRLCVKGDAVVVHFDFVNRVTTSIPQEKRKLLEEHLIAPAE